MEQELQSIFSDRYRRIWVYWTRLGTVQLVLFPVNQNLGYEIITERNFGEITLEKLTDMVNRFI